MSALSDFQPVWWIQMFVYSIDAWSFSQFWPVRNNKTTYSSLVCIQYTECIKKEISYMVSSYSRQIAVLDQSSFLFHYCYRFSFLTFR